MMETIRYGDKEYKFRELGVDYVVVFEYTCEACEHKWRLTMKPQYNQCPKCHSIKLYYVSKRSCDNPVSEEVEIPKESELL